MSKTLLIEPYKYVLEVYADDKNIAVYSNKTIRYWADGAEKHWEICYPSHISSELDSDAAKAKILHLMPLFYRWMGQVDTYEDNLRSFLLYVLSLAESLRSLQIKQVVFFTGVAHHVEYSLIEAACQLAGVRQVYLYMMPFGSPLRLAPIVQSQSIEDRRLFDKDLTSSELREAVLEFRENYLKKNPPRYSGAPGSDTYAGNKAYSVYFAYQKLFERWVKSILRPIFKRGYKRKTHPIENWNDYSFGAIWRIIGRQKRALDHLSSKVVDNTVVEALIAEEGPLPIVYAHYQPEATTFPEGGRFSEHLSVVLAIRKQGYRGKILYKEHPGSGIYYEDISGFSRVGIFRSVAYYNQLEALGCVFVDASFKLSSEHLRAVFPVTITGSVAIERGVTGWRTCCAGLPWFREAPGVCTIEQSFGPNGVFYDPDRWSFDGDEAVAWFDSKLSNRTVTNYPGIGTGILSYDESEKTAFLKEIDLLLASFSAE